METPLHLQQKRFLACVTDIVRSIFAPSSTCSSKWVVWTITILVDDQRKSQHGLWTCGFITNAICTPSHHHAYRWYSINHPYGLIEEFLHQLAFCWLMKSWSHSNPIIYSVSYTPIFILLVFHCKASSLGGIHMSSINRAKQLRGTRTMYDSQGLHSEGTSSYPSTLGPDQGKAGKCCDFTSKDDMGFQGIPWSCFMIVKLANGQLQIHSLGLMVRYIIKIIYRYDGLETGLASLAKQMPKRGNPGR